MTRPRIPCIILTMSYRTALTVVCRNDSPISSTDVLALRAVASASADSCLSSSVICFWALRNRRLKSSSFLRPWSLEHSGILRIRPMLRRSWKRNQYLPESAAEPTHAWLGHNRGGSAPNHKRCRASKGYRADKPTSGLATEFMDLVDGNQAKCDAKQGRCSFRSHLPLNIDR